MSFGDLDGQCCGSGCNNCVLDQRKNTTISSINEKTNIFSKKYQHFSLNNISRHTDSVYEFSFIFTNTDYDNLDNYTLNIPPGHHLILRSLNSNSASPDSTAHTECHKLKNDLNTLEDYISRPYTPIKVNREKLQFTILVKLEPFGQMSKYLQSLTIGHICEWKGVYGIFNWTPNKYKYLLCIYHGVAAAPIYRVVSSIFANAEDETRIIVRGCFATIDQIVLRKEFYAFHQYWNLASIVYYLSRESCTCTMQQQPPSVQNCKCKRDKLLYNETACVYRLNDQELSKAFIEKMETFTIVCGTEAFIKQIKCHLEKLAIPNENIFIF